ncbi:MAG TPA: oligosaccharide flippase family protein, partial [Chloroflexota bacterium]|nr:oligosaccharide flippase family protein [Chloroflexota bacterium]
WPLLGGALVLGISMLAGHIEASVYVMAAMGLYALARLVQLAIERGPLRALGRAAISCAALVVLGVGLAAVQVLPFYEVGSLNFRSGAVTYRDVAGFALKLPQLFTFLMPDFYGNPTISWAPYWGVKDYVEQAAYVGILPLLLAGFTVFALARRGSKKPGEGSFPPQIAALWFVIAVSLLLAFGTPLYRVVFFLLPGFNQIHSPFRWLIPYTGAMALLAGFGVDLVRERFKWARLAFGAVAVLALAGLAVWPRVVHARVPKPADWPLEARNYAILLALVLASALIVWTGRRWFAVLAIVLVGGDLAYFGVPFNTAADPAPLHATPAIVQFLQQDQSLFRVTAFGDDEMFQPNGNLLYGLQDARGYDSVILGSYARLNELLEPQDQLQYNRIQTLDQPAALDSPVLSLLNVKYVLTTGTLPSPNFRRVYSGPDGNVYQNERVLPRAFVAGSSLVAPAATEELQALTQVDLASTVIVPKPVGQQGTSGPATVTSYTARKVDVRASGPGVLVLTDTNYPGWKVSVDGQPAELLTADYAFRGVDLPPGQHAVEFTFSPTSVIVGGLISGLTLAVILLAAVAYAYQRRMAAAQLPTAGRVAKNSFAPLASNVSSRLISFGFSVFYFRVLDPSQIGEYVVAVTVWLFMDTVIGFGLAQFVSRDVARDKSQTSRYLSNALAVRLTLSVLVGAPVALGAAAMSHFGRIGPDLPLVLGLLIAGFIPAAVSNVVSHIFDGHELMEYRAFSEVLTAIVNVALGVAFIVVGLGIAGLALAALLTNVFTAGLFAVLFVQRLGRPRLQLDTGLLRRILHGAYPIMLNQLLVVLFFKIDVPILGAFRASAEVALYGAAYKFVDAMLIVPANFVPAVFPILSRQAAGEREALRRGYEVTLKVLLLISLPVLVAFEVYAGDIIHGFYGDKYAASAGALRILMLFLPFSYANGLIQYILVALDRQKTMLRFFGITAVFNVAVNLALIPHFGYLAAAAVTAASEVVLLAPLAWLAGRELKAIAVLPSVAWRPAVAALFAGLGMFGLRRMLGDAFTPLLASGLAGAAIYGVLLVVLRTFTQDELRLLRGLLPRRGRALVAAPVP